VQGAPLGPYGKIYQEQRWDAAGYKPEGTRPQRPVTLREVLEAITIQETLAAIFSLSSPFVHYFVSRTIGKNPFDIGFWISLVIFLGGVGLVYYLVVVRSGWRPVG